MANENIKDQLANTRKALAKNTEILRDLHNEQQQIATSALSTMTHEMTPVPEGATFEEKYNALLQDYSKLQHKHSSLKSEIYKDMLHIQTARKQIKSHHDQIQHLLFAMHLRINHT